MDVKHRWVGFSHFSNLVSISNDFVRRPNSLFLFHVSITQHIFHCFIFPWKVSLILSFFHCKNICATLLTDTARTIPEKYNIFSARYYVLALLKLFTTPCNINVQRIILALMNEPHSFWHL